MTTSSLDRPTPDRLAVTFGWVSLLQDLGSKMVAPLVPLLLAGPLGAAPVVIGLVDAAGEATASLTAMLGGRLADRRAPVPLVRAGYLLSSLAKVAIGTATAWPLVLALRLADRVGKGLRDAPRDLLLADADARGRSFGIQQAMDKVGGVLGPVLGAGLYLALDEQIRLVFLAAVVPCLASVVVLWRTVDRRLGAAAAGAPVTTGSPAPVAPPTPSPAPPIADPRIRRTLATLALHAAASLPLGLLLLRMVGDGSGVVAALVVYAGNRAVVAALALPAGSIADRFGARRVSAVGMATTALAMGLFAVGGVAAAAGLVVAGAGDALVRSPAKALVAGLVERRHRGWVLGRMGAWTGLASLAGALLAGALWRGDGRASFAVAAAAAGIAAALHVVDGPRTSTDPLSTTG